MHKSEMADPHYVDSCPKVVRLEAVRVLRDKKWLLDQDLLCSEKTRCKITQSISV